MNEPDEPRQYPYEIVTVPRELSERLADNPVLLAELKERHDAAAKYIEALNRRHPVSAYIITGSSKEGENLRPGRVERRPSSFVDLKENFPSDIDVLVCVEGDLDDSKYIQSEADSLAMINMLGLGYYVHPQVYTRQSLGEAVSNLGDKEWYSDLNELKRKVDEGG